MPRVRAPTYAAPGAANPACAEGQNDLGVLLAKMGRAGEASEHFRAALCIRPDYREAEDNLRLSKEFNYSQGGRMSCGQPGAE
jgi:hypothetical protein